MKPRLKVYLSGPMTGYEAWNYPRFHAMADYLRDKGYVVFNPAEAFDGNTELSWTAYMTADIEALMGCDLVVALPGWDSSTGARLEVACARALGLKVLDENLKPLYEGQDTARSDVEALLGINKRRPALDEQRPAPAPQENILQEAQRLVHGDRQADYGHPLDDFTKTATIWSALLGTQVTAEQVALCMIGVKLSREVNRTKRDNAVDIAGYAATLEMVIQERERRTN